MHTWSRRRFLTRSALAAGAAGLLRPRPAVAAASGGSPNGNVRVAIVGFNGKGGAHIKAFQKMSGVTLAALCDVDSRLLARGAAELEKNRIKVATYTDYRKLLESREVDAVVIATPNHWHALMAIWGCQAGKDVYVEKPVSHNVWEGRKIVEAARRYGRIVQTGTQSRSDAALAEAFAEIQAGKYGRIQWARGLCYKPRPSIGKSSGPQLVPSHIDYDLWSGPAPLVPPRRNSSNGTVHYDWHWFWNYGGGDIANQGIHEMDMCRWVLGEPGLPPAVVSYGGRFGYDDDAETPNTQVAVYAYARAPLIFEVRGLPRRTGERAMDAYRGSRVGLVVQCEHAYFAGGAGGGAFYDAEGKKLKAFSGPGGGEHQANFIAAVRSRRESDLAAPIEGGHLSSALCHLGNISYRLGQNRDNPAIREAMAGDANAGDSFARMLEHLTANAVDVNKTPTVLGPRLALAPGTETFATKERFDAGFWANTMLRRDYRAPYVVPEQV
ncbi:MAG: Gfo/Idh/MocA family oxidoreductase [Verrucomicrobia bacterium]|nr:Gfo/Idh/MocA family oxidoreductase [Verrucomicrobiota bacterium]